jgi:hypothetical protein
MDFYPKFLDRAMTVFVIGDALARRIRPGGALARSHVSSTRDFFLRGMKRETRASRNPSCASHGRGPEENAS